MFCGVVCTISLCRTTAFFAIIDKYIPMKILLEPWINSIEVRKHAEYRKHEVVWLSTDLFRPLIRHMLKFRFCWTALNDDEAEDALSRRSEVARYVTYSCHTQSLTLSSTFFRRRLPSVAAFQLDNVPLVPFSLPALFVIFSRSFSHSQMFHKR